MKTAHGLTQGVPEQNKGGVTFWAAYGLIHERAETQVSRLAAFMESLDDGPSGMRTTSLVSESIRPHSFLSWDAAGMDNRGGQGLECVTYSFTCQMREERWVTLSISASQNHVTLERVERREKG